MSDSVVYLRDIDGGSLTVRNEGKFRFRTGAETIDIVFPLEALPKIAATLLVVAAAGQEAQSPGSGASGFPAESIDLKDSGNGWTVLQFGHMRGLIPIALDSGQVAELRRLLPNKTDQKG